MRKHHRTRATEIPRQVRMTVGVRDNGLCVVCGKMGIPNAHFIARSQGGLGIEENIVTLCLSCHHEFDNGKNGKWYENIIRKYLQEKYPEWDEKKLIYKKWSDVNE